MQITQNLIVKSTHHSKPIVTDIFYKRNTLKKPIVIFCHGYKGYKDWGAWNLVAKEFAETNLFFVKFNFSHNGGTINNPIDFPDLESFGNNNFIKELDDLDDVIKWVLENPDFENEIETENITLIGHSRGGGIVTIKASENNLISKIISWAGVSDFGARFPKGELLQGWKEQGISHILNTRTKQKMPHSYQFYENFKENEDRLTIQSAVKKLNIPHLIIQGDNDEVVLPIEAHNLHSWNPKSELIFIAEMNHPLGCAQPWNKQTLPAHLQEVVTKSIDFVIHN